MSTLRSPSPLRRWRVPIGLVSLALATSAACTREPDPPGEEAELRALLDDDELEGVIRRAQTIKADAGAIGGAGGTAPDGGSMGGSAGSIPDGGMGGSGGSPSDGGFGGGGGGGCLPGGGMGGRPGPIDAGFPSDGPGGSGGSGGGGACVVDPLGKWDMDDCNSSRSELFDGFQNGFTAFRTVNAQCVPGVEGQAVSLPGSKDLLYVPDQPAFTFGGGVTVAAWVKPNRLNGTQTIFRKREGTTSSLALMLVNGKWTFVIDRVGATPISVTATARNPGVWQHVAATYDNSDLRLYVNGTQVATLRRSGTIKGGEGPLLMANDGSARRFDGAIDKVWFAVAAAPAETIASLLCIHQPLTMVGTPAMSAPVAPGTSVTFDFAITNPSSIECAPSPVVFFSNNFRPDFNVNPQFQVVEIPSQGTAHVPVVVTSSEDVEPGAHTLFFQAFANDRVDQNGVLATVDYVAELGGCHVSTRKELMIRDVSVVDDPIRSGFGAPASDPRRGVWTFKHLVEQLAPTAAQAPDVVEALLGTFGTTQTVNGFSIQARPGMQQQILAAWPRVDGKLDLEQAPLRLLAIVNRMDLRNLDNGHAGEGRFVFGFLGGGMNGFPLEATLILEYHQLATTEAEVTALANQWHALGALPFPSEEYNAALQVLTDRFSRRGAAPGRPNGSALSQLRTNEIAFGQGAPWELREFNFDAAGQLVPATIKLTPDRPTLEGTGLLSEWVNANQVNILLERHEVPASFQGTPFAVGAVFNDLTTWANGAIIDPEVRHKFALNTCNGCHSLQETNTFFLQIAGRFPGQEAPLSPFLTGTTVFDRVTGQPRTLNDLSRRNADLKQIVCQQASTARAASGPNLRRGIGRVH